MASINLDKMDSVNLKVKVTSKALKNVSTGTILEMLVSDVKSFARCIAWNNLASFFDKRLSLDQTYLMSGVHVRKIKPQYQYQGTLPIELTLSGGIDIKTSQSTIDTVPETTYCKIKELNQALNTRVNIIGIVKSYENTPTHIVTQQGKSVIKKEFTIVDDTEKEATSTLWEI